MGRLVVVLDRGVGISPAEFSATWAGDAEARGVGVPSVDAAAPGDFFGVVVGRLVGKARPDKADQPVLQIAELTRADGDRVVVVRLGGAYR